jgi:uncharacterized membrane protein YgaE (UPF0421/DUF939 family)
VSDSVFEKVRLAIRAALAVSVSLAIAGFTHLHQPIYAVMAAIMVTDTSADKTRRLGARRLIATVIGTACGGVMSAFLPQNPWIVGLGTLVAMLACIFFQAAEAARVAGYVCGIILLGLADDPWKYSVNRFVETVLGVGVAWGISMIPALSLPRAHEKP